LEGLGIENVDIIDGHLECLKAFMALWYTLWLFGIIYGSLVYFMAL
jgi:hypothetical protein